MLSIRWSPLFVFLGCGGAGVVLTPDRDTYRGGESVTLTLFNNAGTTLGYNLCLSELQSTSGQSVDDRDGSFCQAIELELRPGSRSTGKQHPLPLGLSSGSYKYVTLVNGPRAELEPIESTSFEVIGDSVR